jgi:hypothetical protein
MEACADVSLVVCDEGYVDVTVTQALGSEVNMELPFGMLFLIVRRGMQSHRIREWSLL